MRVLSLHTPVQTAADHQFTAFVDEIGKDTSGSRQRLPLLHKTTEIDDAKSFLFPLHILADARACLDRAFLSPRNIFVDEFNDLILESLPGDYRK